MMKYSSLHWYPFLFRKLIQAMFLPAVMEKAEKMPKRHGIIPRSTDLYDGSFNDQEVLQYESLVTLVWGPKCNGKSSGDSSSSSSRNRT